MTVTTPPASQRLRRVPQWVIAVVGATAVMWVISAVSMYVYTADARQPQEYTLVIPAGTGASIAAGENPLLIPATWSFRSDDTLVLHNEDVMGHWLGTFFVPPGETREYLLRPSFAGVFACSLHPSGEIVVDVGLRAFDWGQTMIPTLLLGPVLGLVALAIGRVVRGLE